MSHSHAVKKIMVVFLIWKWSSHKPVQKKNTSIPRPLYPYAKQYIEDLLNQNFIVESKSPYSPPVVCVREKDVHCGYAITTESLTAGLLLTGTPFLETKKHCIVLVKIVGSVSLIRAPGACKQGMYSSKCIQYTMGIV